MMNRIASATVKKEPFAGEIFSVGGKCELGREDNHWLFPGSHTDRPLTNVNSRKIGHYQRSELTAVFAKRRDWKMLTQSGLMRDWKGVRINFDSSPSASVHPEKNYLKPNNWQPSARKRPRHAVSLNKSSAEVVSVDTYHFYSKSKVL